MNLLKTQTLYPIYCHHLKKVQNDIFKAKLKVKAKKTETQRIDTSHVQASIGPRKT